MNKTDRDLQRLEQMNDFPSLTDAFQRIIADFGFASFEMVETTDLHPHTPFHFGTSGAWRRLYIANGFRFVDPYLAKSRHCGLPFDLSSIPPEFFTTKPLIKFVQAAREVGIQECLCCPHHMRTMEGRPHSHFLALIWTEHAEAFRLMLTQHRHDLLVITMHFMERVVTLRGLRQEIDTTDNLLTERERQILELSAHGMTGEEIAIGLRISVLTAQTHLKNATRKLQARNRTHAVALSIKRGLISG